MRRPGAAEEIELDLEILRNLAARASQRWKEAEHWDLNGLARDFADLLRAELDYLQEAGNAQAVRGQLRRRSRGAHSGGLPGADHLPA